MNKSDLFLFGNLGHPPLKVLIVIIKFKLHLWLFLMQIFGSKICASSLTKWRQIANLFQIKSINLDRILMIPAAHLAWHSSKSLTASHTLRHLLGHDWIFVSQSSDSSLWYHYTFLMTLQRCAQQTSLLEHLQFLISLINLPHCLINWHIFKLTLLLFVQITLSKTGQIVNIFDHLQQVLHIFNAFVV